MTLHTYHCKECAGFEATVDWPVSPSGQEYQTVGIHPKMDKDIIRFNASSKIYYWSIDIFPLAAILIHHKATRLYSTQIDLAGHTLYVNELGEEIEVGSNTVTKK